MYKLREIGTIGFDDDGNSDGIASAQHFSKMQLRGLSVVFQLQFYLRTCHNNVA